MSDSDDQVPLNAPNKVSPLPSRLVRHLEFVAQELEKKDAESSDHKPVELKGEGGIGDGTGSMGPQTKHEPIEQPRPADGSEAILKAMIGLSLMIVGVAAMLAVGDLPKKGLTQIFLAAAVIFLGGGAWRIDKAIRSYRENRHTTNIAKRRT